MCLSQDDLIGSDGVRPPWTDLNSRMITFIHDEGDITENGLDDRAAYMWDPEAENWIPTPGGYVFWQPAGDMAAADDADARKIRTPGLTLLAAQLKDASERLSRDCAQCFAAVHVDQFHRQRGVRG